MQSKHTNWIWRAFQLVKPLKIWKKLPIAKVEISYILKRLRTKTYNVSSATEVWMTWSFVQKNVAAGMTLRDSCHNIDFQFQSSGPFRALENTMFWDKKKQ